MLVLTHLVPAVLSSPAGFVTPVDRGPHFLDYDPGAYVVEECSQCPDRRSAVMLDSQGREVVREWHDPGCPTLLEWL